jgi:hypothetical protein
LAVLDKWTEALDMGENMDTVYLDFAKAKAFHTSDS